MATQSALQYCLTFTHSYTAVSATHGCREESRVGCLAQGHLETQLGGAGDRTNNLLVASHPALPPEPHAALVITSCTSLTPLEDVFKHTHLAEGPRVPQRAEAAGGLVVSLQTLPSVQTGGAVTGTGRSLAELPRETSLAHTIGSRNQVLRWEGSRLDRDAMTTIYNNL